MVEMVKSALHAYRKLVAILAADVVGYSCHMEQDVVAEQTPYIFDDVGEQWVKNLAEPIRAYGIRFVGGRALRTAVCDSAAATVMSPVASPLENTSSCPPSALVRHFEANR